MADYLEIKDDKRVPSKSHIISSKYRVEDNRLVLKEPVSFNFTGTDWGNIEPIIQTVVQGIWVSYEIYTASPILKQHMRGRWIKLGTDLLKVVGKISRFT